ncbi:MAG TPA: pitrilysin family protein [Coleofasciculaceae cyanobacterium]|jgi:zinc protease
MPEASAIQIPYVQDEARVVTYDNGYTFVFVPKKGDVFNISTWVKTGSIHEDDRISGISHFLEHLMFKGTERFRPGEFDKAMESMGAVINAATWKDFTFYYITGPKGKAEDGGIGENFQRALDMHSDMMLGSTIPDEEVGPPYDPFDADYKGEKRERSVVIEEISMREDQPWTKIYNSVNGMMYRAGHPYRRDVIGTRQIIGEVPRETIYDYYRRWYSPANLTTIVVGDFDFATLEEKIGSHFDFRKFGLGTNGQPLRFDSAALKPPAEKRYDEITGDYQTTFFIIGFHGPDPANLKESIALDVASHVLGESRSSRLTQALLEKPANPIYNFVSCGQSTFKLGNVFFIQGNFTAADTKSTLKQLETEVERMLTAEPISEDEFRRAVKKLKVSFAETSETASGIAETIGEALTVMGNLDCYLHYLDVLNSLDVNMVNAVARQYLSLDKAYTSVMVPSGEAEESNG